jgi:hypothetical protein
MMEKMFPHLSTPHQVPSRVLAWEAANPSTQIATVTPNAG